MFDGISTNNPGTADLVVNLSPYSLGSNGLLVVKSVAGSGHSLAAGTTLVANSFFTQSGGFNNGTLSFYLFFSPSPFSSGADYDANNDGVLDNLPSGSQVLDDVALLDNNSSASGDKAYGPAVVCEYNNTGTPDAATRFTGNITPSSSAAWYGGELVDTGNVASQINYDATRESAQRTAQHVSHSGRRQRAVAANRHLDRGGRDEPLERCSQLEFRDRSRGHPTRS